MSKTEEGRLTVTEMYSQSGEVVDETSEEEVISVREFKTEPAKVNVKLGRTINLGNYESLRIDVGVQLPCYVEEMDKAYKTAYKFAEKKIVKKKDEVKSVL